MNSYEMKLEAKRARLERAAERAAAESNAAHKRSRDLVAGIPFGQPILVGHHSEKRHRNAVDKSWNALGKAVQKTKEAEDYARRAAAVGTGGISADDPEAVDKLTDKVSELEAKRDRMKLVNKLYRKADRAGLEALGLNYDSLKSQIDAIGYSWDKQPYASYTLTNLGARIRDAKKRAERLERHQATAVDALIELEGATVKADAEDNRIVIRFHNYLTKDSYKTMRSAGFVWSPTRDGFTRKLSSYSVESARALAVHILIAEENALKEGK